MTRLEDHLESKKFFAPSQYGFHSRRSTAGAAIKLKKVAKKAITDKRFCTAVGLNIRNAFNLIPWEKIMEGLRKARVPTYLIRMINGYLSNQCIMADSSGGIVKSPVTCGVPQESVLGLTLWDVAFNGIIRLELPPEVQLICYADDTLVVA